MVGEIITAGCHSLPDVMTVQSDIMRDRLGHTVESTRRMAGAAQSQSSDREVIQSWVKQVIVHPDHILLELDREAGLDDTRIKIAFTPYTKPRKGIAYSPAASNTLTGQTRDTLLGAILRSPCRRLCAGHPAQPSTLCMPRTGRRSLSEHRV